MLILDTSGERAYISLSQFEIGIQSTNGPSFLAFNLQGETIPHSAYFSPKNGRIRNAFLITSIMGEENVKFQPAISIRLYHQQNIYCDGSVLAL